MEGLQEFAPPWQSSARCRGLGWGTFFVADAYTRQVERAKKVCRKCPVRSECLEYAIKHDEDGIWGGTTKSERAFIVAAKLLLEDDLEDNTLPSTSQTPQFSLHIVYTPKFELPLVPEEPCHQQFQLTG